jgi:hypothetical protein
VTVEGINIVIPEFERNTLTHFQNCQARVEETPSSINLYIYSHQCAHPLENYDQIL